MKSIIIFLALFAACHAAPTPDTTPADVKEAPESLWRPSPIAPEVISDPKPDEKVVLLNRQKRDEKAHPKPDSVKARELLQHNPHHQQQSPAKAQPAPLHGSQTHEPQHHDHKKSKREAHHEEGHHEEGHQEEPKKDDGKDDHSHADAHKQSKREAHHEEGHHEEGHHEEAKEKALPHALPAAAPAAEAHKQSKREAHHEEGHHEEGHHEEAKKEDGKDDHSHADEHKQAKREAHHEEGHHEEGHHEEAKDALPHALPADAPAVKAPKQKRNSPTKPEASGADHHDAHQHEEEHSAKPDSHAHHKQRREAPSKLAAVTTDEKVQHDPKKVEELHKAIESLASAQAKERHQRDIPVPTEIKSTTAPAHTHKADSSELTVPIHHPVSVAELFHKEKPAAAAATAGSSSEESKEKSKET
ncbi:sarcoplasmic reticulum histidine-rich calcium-binding protein isoform X1 [Drosophila subobscura]|uniref:sarcoplasmic reticulum histidine-rich calcium-binding protein isoform X1 n=1 Tax=Drosophila subobscura TaxID=7241 RepID=UPI00155A9490|nr:sarcoplasmic reticulum histidine-rich calcium-binding protein isoform X1 [Drosophila subobscura]